MDLNKKYEELKDLEMADTKCKYFKEAIEKCEQAIKDS
jgi:hypothetical protein